jgi:hypothetical protein
MTDKLNHDHDLTEQRHIDDLVRIDQRANITPQELAALRREVKKLTASLEYMTADRDSEQRWAKTYFDLWQATLPAAPDCEVSE